MGIRDRLAHAWNAFVNLDLWKNVEHGGFYTSRPDRTQFHLGNERSIIAAIYTRLGIDAASVDIRHVRLDEDERYSETLKSGLNECLRVSANTDQAGRHFRKDIVDTMLDKGVVAVIPVDTTVNPVTTGGYEIKSMRVGTVVEWYPYHVRVEAYNEKTGRREQVTLDKSFVAIVENPFYEVMNKPNSTLKRLLRKLALLDTVDEQSSSGKLDLIFQLPYVVKSDTRRSQAEQRRKEIEAQLRGSKYGIAWTDATEKITQLNRPVENNLLTQIEMLTNQLYVQLGLTPEVMNGTADEAAMLNYFNRTIEPIVDAVVEEMNRKFLTRTARTQGQAIMYFRDPFKLVPIEQIAEIGDKFIRNEIASPNDLRVAIGWKPSKDPKANELRNPNMPAEEPPSPSGPDPNTMKEGDGQNGRL